MLIEYFKLNARNNTARQYLYSQNPQNYVFKKEKIDGKIVSHWQPRQSQFNTIGRMFSVSPAQNELFHLRILLLTIKGATSFNDLKTVNSQIVPTFAEACLKLGLIENDEEWRRALTEATLWMMPYQLRCLFARILIHCQPTNPEALWNEFKLAMSKDYLRKFNVSQSEKIVYDQVQVMLKDHN